MPKFKITRRGAQHRRKEDGNWRTYGQGDTIELSRRAYDSGAYSHLGLQQTSGDVRTTDVADPVTQSKVQPPIQNKITDGSRTPDGNQTQAQDALVSDEVDRNDEQAGQVDQTQGGGDEQSQDPEVQKVDALIADVDATNSAETFREARGRVEAAGVLKEVPARKADTLTALREHREELAGSQNEAQE